MAKKISHGRGVAAGQWAHAEWDALNRLWKAGVPVPYPVQSASVPVPLILLGHPPLGLRKMYPRLSDSNLREFPFPVVTLTGV